MALKCFVTNKKTRETSLVENEDFEFCSIFPSIQNSAHFTTSISEGLKSAELDKPFEKLFKDNNDVYSTLSVCLFEKYDWGKMFSPKHSLQKVPGVEYTFRCICNTDLCNRLGSFSSHVQGHM